MANLIRVREAQSFHIPMFLSDVEIVIKKIIIIFFFYNFMGRLLSLRNVNLHVVVCG